VSLRQLDGTCIVNFLVKKKGAGHIEYLVLTLQ